MATSDRSLPIPYVPNPPPGSIDDAVRAAWDEFYRVQQALVDLDRPIALATTTTKTVPVDNVKGNWTRLFNTPATYEWEQPAGMMDQTTGVWTCPSEGLYQINPRLEVPPFPTPQQKAYQASLRVSKVSGGVTTAATSTNGGNDTQPLSVSASIMRPLIKGDQIYMDADIYHDGTSGTAQCFAVLNIVRLSGIR